jgi:hypothetical protein
MLGRAAASVACKHPTHVRCWWCCCAGAGIANFLKVQKIMRLLRLARVVKLMRGMKVRCAAVWTAARVAHTA